MIITGSKNGIARVWEVNKFENIKNIIVGDSIFSMAIFSNVLVLGHSTKVNLYDFSLDQKIQEFQSSGYSYQIKINRGAIYLPEFNKIVTIKSKNVN